MKLAGPLRHFLFAFIIALAGYIFFFYFIENHRSRNGPWRVAFASPGGDATPFLIINEPQLGISNVRVSFARQTAPKTNAVIIFGQPRETPYDVPFGKCIFMDGITKPGTVTLNLLGHEIQMLPRVLTIDGKEHPWRSETTITVLP
jgi:hypothetical protein